MGSGLTKDAPVRTMDTEALAKYLTEQGMEKFASVVTEKGVDGAKLSSLTAKSLDELGITDNAEKNELLTLVSKLNGIVLKLSYFPVEARAGPARLALAVGGVPYWDNRIPFPVWKELKPTTPYGSMPLLEYIGPNWSPENGSSCFAGSHAIVQFACNIAGLPQGGFSPEETELVDAVLAINFDFDKKHSKVVVNKDVALRAQLANEIIPEYFSRIEKLMTASGPLLLNSRTRPPCIIIAGPPAGGKGTQCAMLKEKFGVVHLSTGDMLRAAAEAGTELGLAAKKLMDAGELVGDDVMVGLITERLKEQDCVEKGWLLDGFPRTAVQAEALARHTTPDVFLQLNVPDEEIVKRVSGRRLDPETGEIYHLEFNPPPNEEIAARLTQRSDDTEEKVIARLGKYHENINSVARVYSSGSDPALVTTDSSAKCINKVWAMDGNRDKMEVFADCEAAVQWSASTRLSAADFVLATRYEFLKAGILDGVPPTCVDGFDKVKALVDKVYSHPRIVAYKKSLEKSS